MHLVAIRLITEPFEPEYMRRALAALIVLGVLGGVVGVVVQLRKLAFLTDAMTHVVFPGVAIAFFTRNSVTLGAIVAAVAAATLLTLAARSRSVDEDGMIGLLLASFFAVGVIVVSRSRTYTADITELLFGRVLTMTDRQVVETLVIAGVALAVVWLLRKEILLRSFDPVTYEALGYRVFTIDLITNVVIALVVVASVRAVGTALVVALLITPSATARLVCNRLVPLVVVSCSIAVVSGWLGLAISYDASVNHDVRLAPGATVVVVMTAMFVVVAVGSALVRHRRRDRLTPTPPEPKAVA